MGVNNYPLARKLGLKLKAAGKMLAVAESCTGGALARVITRVPGSSEWFDCGFVTYSNLSKVELLGVDEKAIDKYGAVSEEVARQMALGVIKYSHADISLSITGVAGPSGGTLEKPVGTVWVGLALKGGGCQSHQAFFEGGRKYVCVCSIAYGLKWLSQVISAGELK